MDTCRVSLEEVTGKCSWCGRSIPKDSPVFGVGARKRPEIDISEFEGGAIRISLLTQDRDIIAFVPGADSEARQDGYDLMSMVCSEVCGSEMKATLEEEIAFGNVFFNEIDNMEN